MRLARAGDNKFMSLPRPSPLGPLARFTFEARVPQKAVPRGCRDGRLVALLRVGRRLRGFETYDEFLGGAHSRWLSVSRGAAIWFVEAGNP
jgi:hypothetical protein